MRPTHLPLTIRLTLAIALLGPGCGGDDDPMSPDAGPAPEPPVTPLVFPDEPFRGTRPTPAPEPSFQAPRAESFQLANGLQVFLVERRTIPHVSWQLTFPTGSMMDPPGKEGLASLCLNVSYQATTKLPRQEREQVLADLGASVNLLASTGNVAWSGNARPQDLNFMAALWMDLFLAPALTQSDFDGTLRARVNSLAAPPAQTPGAIASRVSSRLFWGRQHPFNRVSTTASLQAITLADCKDFFARVVRPTGAKLYVWGALNRTELMATFALLGTLPAGGTLAMPPPPPAPGPGGVFFVHAPGAPQSIITIRGNGPVRTAPDFYAAEMMAAILTGDSTSSRIGLNVREMRGYAYSVSGYFTYGSAGGGFFFSSPVRADVTAESLHEVLEEVRKVRETGVTMEELDRERRGRLAGLPYLFETAGLTLTQYEILDGFGIPPTYFDTYARNFSAVTLADAQQAAVTYLAPGTLQILVVGDAPVSLTKLQALAAMRPDLMASPVIQLDGEGNPVP